MTEQQPNPTAPPGRVCATCRWWHPEHEGMCGQLHLHRAKPAAFARDDSGEPVAIITTPDFGCNQWQAKP